MARATDKKAILIQTLQDGGCDQKTIVHCLELAEKGETKEIIRIMSQKKQNILDIVHCFLQVLFGQNCKIFLDIVACPNWTKLQSLG